MDAQPDLTQLSDEELKSLIRQLTEEERAVSMQRRVLHESANRSRVAACAAIGPDAAQPSMAVGNQPKRHSIGPASSFRCLKDCLHEFVVEKRRADDELRLFNRQCPIVVPGCLPEHGK